MIFKGGTSLFKAYRFINRFSEDIDVTFKRFVNKSIIKRIEARVMANPFVKIEDPSQYKNSRGSKFRSVAYRYPTVFVNEVTNLKPFIVFESYSHYTSHPYEKKLINSLI